MLFLSWNYIIFSFSNIKALIRENKEFSFTIFIMLQNSTNPVAWDEDIKRQIFLNPSTEI